MNTVNKINLKLLYDFNKNENKTVIDWCMNEGLISNRYKCPVCALPRRSGQTIMAPNVSRQFRQGAPSSIFLPETVFLLNLFSPLFSRTDLLFQVLQADSTNILSCLNVIRDFQEVLENARKCDESDIIGFPVIWEKTVSVAGLPKNSRKRKIHGNNESSLTLEQRCRKLFYEVTHNLISHLSSRFSSLKKLAFFDLLNPKQFKNFTEKNDFPEQLLTNLGELYPQAFDITGLKNELIVFHRTSTFNDKCPQKLIKFLKEGNLHFFFKEIFKLSKLILTISATIALVERSFSAIKRIHTHKRSTQTEDSLSNLALLSFETELLMSLKEREDFYIKITNKFTSKTRRLEFMYK
ncbi:zinc finger MYM-type protein 1-like [Parasteatoda tepidariorum]|uniref:zinc finger MYM-type protein 1-like n=1 Tax=Parasteatoda tepidariorum TaxID=114398 RepID=UPI0039BD3695